MIKVSSLKLGARICLLLDAGSDESPYRGRQVRVSQGQILKKFDSLSQTAKEVVIDRNGR